MIKCRPTKTMRTFGATFDPNTKYYKIWCHLRLHFYSLPLILYWNPILSWAKMMNGQMSPLPNTIKYGVICVCIFIPFFWSCIGTLFYHGIKWWTFYVLGPLFIVVFFLSTYIHTRHMRNNCAMTLFYLRHVTSYDLQTNKYSLFYSMWKKKPIIFIEYFRANCV